MSKPQGEDKQLIGECTLKLPDGQVWKFKTPVLVVDGLLLVGGPRLWRKLGTYSELIAVSTKGEE